MTDATPDVLVSFGWNDHWSDVATRAASATGIAGRARPGRVVRHDGVAVRVALADGVVQLPIRGTVAPLAVGDWVLVADDAVAVLLPRDNVLRRRDVDKETAQLLAANVDMVLVVCGLDRPVKEGRIRRTVLLAADAGATPLVVLTKADLVDDAHAVADRVRAENPGADVLLTSTAGEGIAALGEVLAGRTAVMVGESGAGKSTLTNALAGADLAAIGAVRGTDAKGRHTTTSRELHPLPGGGVVVDSPGIRSVGVWIDPDALADEFDDIEELATGCRFRDCAHATEPGCAVTAAMAAGTLDLARVAAWRALFDDEDAPSRGPHR